MIFSDNSLHVGRKFRIYSYITLVLTIVGCAGLANIEHSEQLSTSRLRNNCQKERC